MPVYLQRFRCIGPDCESNCCSGWTVPVDDRSYERFITVPERALRASLQDNLVRIDSGQIKEEWSLRLRAEDNACHFLSPKRLCTLQAIKGLDFLCVTCATYPRVAVRVDGEVQRAGVLSCPEVARLALFSTRAMSLVRQREPANTRDELAADMTTSTAHLGDPMASFPLLRQGALNLLRQPVSNPARLVGLGRALSRLTAEKLYPEEVTREFGAVLGRVQEIEAEVAAEPGRPELALALMRGLDPGRFFDGRAAGSYLACYQQALAGLQGSAGDYVAGLRRYEAYVASHPAVIQNFLLNCVYATAFPFTEGKGVFEDYVALVLRYCLFKLHLVGMCLHAGKLTDKHVVDIVHRLQRAIDHNQGFRSHARGLINIPEGAAMEYLTGLIVS